jgi:tetratricopeptide (TPR) repeat protein
MTFFVFLLVFAFCWPGLEILWKAIKRRSAIAALPVRHQAAVYANSGQTAKALALIRQLPQLPQIGNSVNAALWSDLNSVVNVSVNAGRYAHAIACTEPWRQLLHEAVNNKLEVSPHRRHGRQDPAVLLINQAEALHNLGRDPEALALLENVDQQLSESFARAGLQMLRAWILVHLGELEAASVQLESADASEILNVGHEPEVAMTRAALQREQGQLDLALTTAAHAIACSKRASSHRNALIMRASILTQQGNFAAAKLDFQRAFKSEYKAQAAYGLLRYGALLLMEHPIVVDADVTVANPSRDFRLTRDALPERLRDYWQKWDPESGLSLKVPV